MLTPAWVAQLVEHFPEEEGVGGSSPPPSTRYRKPRKGLFLYLDAWGVKRLRALRAGSKDGDMSLCDSRVVVKNT